MKGKTWTQLKMIVTEKYKWLHNVYLNRTKFFLSLVYHYMSRTFSYIFREEHLLEYAKRICVPVILYHVAAHTEKGIEGYIRFHSTTREKKVRDLFSAGKDQIIVHIGNGTDRENQQRILRGNQSMEEWNAYKTLGPRYGHGMQKYFEYGSLSTRLVAEEQKPHNHAAFHLFMNVTSWIGNQRKLHAFLSLHARRFTYHHTGTEFECQVLLKKRSRPHAFATQCSIFLKGCICTARASKENILPQRTVDGPWTEIASTMNTSYNFAPWQRRIIQDIEQNETVDGNTTPVTVVATVNDLPMEDIFFAILCKQYSLQSVTWPGSLEKMRTEMKVGCRGYVFFLPKRLDYEDCVFLQQVKNGCVLSNLGDKKFDPPYVLCMCRSFIPFDSSLASDWKRLSMSEK